MAKIIYGVAGQGFGHSTRSREILKYLVSQGHKVLVFTYGQGLFFLQKEFTVYEIPGLGLSYKNNKLSYLDTIYKNTLQLAKQSRHWKKILNKFREFNPDLVITDFESLSAVLAKLQRVPLVSIDNMHQITNTKINLPLKYRSDLLADKVVIKSMVWGAKYYLITTFFNTPVKRKNTFIFPPILRQEILDLKPQKQDYILVYQSSNFDSMVEQLKTINQKFVVFGLNKECVEGNIEYKNYDNSGLWLNYLANCRAIIGNAGLSLITESLHLEKPYFAIPVKKQIEQVINAYYLERMGYGIFCDKFNKKDYLKFIKNLPVYDQNLRQYNRADNSAIFKKLDEVIGNLI